MKPWLYLFSLQCLASTCVAQSGFYSRFIDFSNEANTRWEHPPFENLGTMLLDAHLRGELKAYQFNVAHDVLKYAPIPKADQPASWDPKLDYYQEDIVSHNGKVYIVRTDLAGGSTPPDSSNYWEAIDMHGDPISIRHHFPEEADSTTKTYLLSHLIEEEPSAYDPWAETNEYFNDDRVEYQGQNYEAHRNNFLGIVPGTNENFWTPITSHVVMYQPSDLNVIEILYHYQIKGHDTIRTPQMVSVLVMDRYKEVYRNTGLNFFYSDIARHLERSHQPALYLSDIGQVGGSTFLFDEHAKANFSRWIQAKIISKEIKPDKKSMLNPPEFDLFMGTKPGDINATTWYPVQNPATHDFTLVAGKLNTDYDYFTIPVLSIPYKSIEKLLMALPAPHKPKLYKDIFADTFLASSIDTIMMDSIQALPPPAHPPAEFSQMHFDETHFDYTDANPVITAAMPGLWELIASAVSANATRFRPSSSYYPCHFNWKGTEITWSMGSMAASEEFSISHVNPPPGELPKPKWKMKEVGVIYRINLTPAITERYYPLQLVISFEEEAHSDLIDYRVAWEDVLKLVSGKKEYDEFVNGVKKAALNFKQTAISYNQMMVR